MTNESNQLIKEGSALIENRKLSHVDTAERNIKSI